MPDKCGIRNVFSRMVQRTGQRVVTMSDAEDDSDVIALVNRGWRDAYSHLVTKYQGEIGRYMWRFTRDAATCEELVHETFVQAYLSLPTYRGEAHFLFWLRKIATRVGYRFWRERSRQAERFERLPEGDVPAEDATSHSVEAACSKERVYRALEQLPPRDRLVLTLLYLEELNVEEAASVAGWSKSMVKVQAFRARHKMRKLLEDIEKGGVHA